MEPLRGGLFTQEPESYHVVQSRLIKMTFTEWSRRFFADEQSSAITDMVPSVVGRGAPKQYREIVTTLYSLL